MYEPIVIVGGGQAAAQAIETLRKRGHRAPVTLVGEENLLPYQRPPLSKKYLAGTLERDRLLFRHAEHYHGHGIDLRLDFPPCASTGRHTGWISPMVRRSNTRDC